MNDIKGIKEDLNKADLVSDKVIEEVIKIIGPEKWQELNDTYSDICTTPGEIIISLSELEDLQTTTGYYIAKRVDGKLQYWSGCKMGSGWMGGLFSAKVYKTSESAAKTIVSHQSEKDNYKIPKGSWDGAFPLPVYLSIEKGYLHD